MATQTLPASEPPSLASSRRSSFFGVDPASPSLLMKAKRRLSEHRRPSFASLGLSSPTMPSFFKPEPPLPPGSIAHTSHRENTALHALMDTLPTLPSLTPTLPSFNLNLSLPTPSFFCVSGTGYESDSDEDSTTQTQPRHVLEKEVQGDPIKKIVGDVLLTGGYRGSILHDAKTGNRVWIPLKVGFGIRRPDLAIGLDDEDELRSRDTVVPSKMLTSVGGVIDLGKKLKDKLKYHQHLSPVDQNGVHTVRFTNYGYDWRRRLELSSQELVEKLEGLKKASAMRGEGPNGEGEGTTVIAHSMGGLVTLHALSQARDPTIFKAILFAGTPFHGCVNALGPLKKGDGVLFNKDVCSPSVVFSMRSTFYFLPSTGKCFETPDGTELPIDFFDPQTWSDHNLSPVTGHLFDPDSKEKERQRRENRLEAQKAAGGGGLEPNLANEGVGVDGSAIASEVEEVVQEGEATSKDEREPVPASSDKVIGAYLKKTLNRVEKFHQEILDGYDPSKQHLYPPMCILTSQRTPTVRGVMTTSYDSIKDENYDHLLFGPGDGIVLYESAKSLPGRWQNGLVGVEESVHGHVSLLGDLDGVRRCMARLHAAREGRK
ncbi:hypothetical protein MNV49_005649 [Pseudohyphozyma bogoriensis]|nr:hypothetical protein MNV49_005649 [Pseudohyphozyma bogoriensis]